MVIAFLQNYCQGLAGVEAVSALLILLAGTYTGLYRVDGSAKELGRYC